MLRTAKRSSKNVEIEKCHPVIVSADHSTTTRSRSAEMGGVRSGINSMYSIRLLLHQQGCEGPRFVVTRGWTLF